MKDTIKNIVKKVIDMTQKEYDAYVREEIQKQLKERKNGKRSKS